MKTIQYLGLETIPSNLKQAILFRFGHPYALQGMDNLVAGYNPLEKDIEVGPFVSDKKPLPIAVFLHVNGKKYLQLASGMPLHQSVYRSLNENKLNLTDRKVRLYLREVLGCWVRLRIRDNEAMRGFSKLKTGVVGNY